MWGKKWIIMYGKKLWNVIYIVQEVSYELLCTDVQESNNKLLCTGGEKWKVINIVQEDNNG